MKAMLWTCRLLGRMLPVFLAGCAAVGPDYSLPWAAFFRRDSAQAPFVETAQPEKPDGTALYRPDDLPADWWRLYDDAELDRLIGEALAVNDDLRAAAANLERARAVSEEIQAQQRPSLGVNAGVDYGHVSGVQVLQPEMRPDTIWTYSGGVQVAYQVDLVGQIRRAIEAARADAEAAQAALDAARVTVAAETARAYVNICTSGLQLASARHSVEVQKASLDAVLRLQEGGRGTLLDVTRARSQLHQLEASLPPLMAQQRGALYRLAALLGRTPAEMPAGLEECRTPPRLRATLPVGDGATLLRRRPDIREAERSLAAATARIGVATADLYPKISLGLSGASAGPSEYFGQRGTYSWSIGPLISWTVPNTGAVQARIAEAEAGSRGALARFDARVLAALRETESALVAYARQLDRDQALRAARDRSAEAAEQANRLFRYGKTDYLTVLDAERTLASNESALAASSADLGNAEMNLFLALGGGWQNAPAVDTGKAPAAGEKAQKPVPENP